MAECREQSERTRTTEINEQDLHYEEEFDQRCEAVHAMGAEALREEAVVAFAEGERSQENLNSTGADLTAMYYARAAALAALAAVAPRENIPPIQQ